MMEPLRGGRLARLTEEQEKKLKDLRPDEAIPDVYKRQLFIFYYAHSAGAEGRKL